MDNVDKANNNAADVDKKDITETKCEDTKVQDPDLEMKPRFKAEQVSEVVWRLYGLKATEIKELPSYDDLNYYFRVTDPIDNSNIDDVNEHGYVLKVLNSLQSASPDIIDAQHSLQKCIRVRGIPSQLPVLNKSGKEWSLETTTQLVKGQTETYGPYVVRILTYIPGQTFVQTPYVAGSFHNIGKFIGKFHQASKDFHHDFYDSYNFLWSLTQLPEVRKFVKCIKDPDDHKMILEIVNTFETEVVPMYEKFTSGIAHGDINEQNLIMCEVPGQTDVPVNARVHDVSAILDFADVTKSYCVMDVAVCCAYLSIECPEEQQLDVAGHVLAGYQQYSSLNGREIDCLKTLMCSRLCQSLVYGAHSFSQQPWNTYLLTTSYKGWPLLRKLWKTDKQELCSRWTDIIKSYKL